MLGARIPAIDPVCPLCKNKPGSIMHTLFECDFTRAFWWSSILEIRTDSFHGDSRVTIQTIAEVMSAKEVTQFICITWAVWRLQNDTIMGGTAK